jgi:hypothetical protein
MGKIFADSTGKIIYADEESGKLFKRSVDELTTLNFFELIEGYCLSYFQDIFGDYFFKSNNNTQKIICYALKESNEFNPQPRILKSRINKGALVLGNHGL